MLLRSAALLSLLATATWGKVVELPHFSAGEGSDRATTLARDSKWLVHIGDHVYHTPPSESGLSSHVGDYYYVFGSDSALSDELRTRRVGGQGRLHIFHLPEGPSMLQTDFSAGSRRQALSAMRQLQNGSQVPLILPAYQLDSGYMNPLDGRGQTIERGAVSKLTAADLMSILKEITSFPTRSYKDAIASSQVQSYLHQKIAQLGFTCCLEAFTFGGPSTNVLAFAPGSSEGWDVVILGAHYDSISSFGFAPGAEDNGSGLALLLGIMKAFKESNIKTKKSVAFVAFAAEEAGLLGSNAYAEAILSPDINMEQCLPSINASSFLKKRPSYLRRTAANYQAIIMDEVGWQSPALNEATVNLESYDWTKEVMDNLAQASKDHNGDSLRVVHSNNPFGSDHMSFLRRGMPAVLTINGDDEAYPFDHKSGDQISEVSGSLMEKIAKMNMGGLLRLAGVETLPAAHF